jgi:hypothetical protein
MWQGRSWESKNISDNEEICFLLHSFFISFFLFCFCFLQHAIYLPSSLHLTFGLLSEPDAMRPHPDGLFVFEHKM